MADPRLAITVGDPNGIGPEVVVRALASAERPTASFLVCGPREILATTAQTLRLPAPELVMDVALTGPPTPGKATAAGGRAAADAVRMAHDAIRAGRADAMVTAPLNKEALFAAGYRWPGHTEMLAELCGGADVRMMFVGGGLRVVLLTIHQSLRSVPGAITTAGIVDTVRLLARELPRLGVARGRVALCGLNPHAGEGGLFGDEEATTFAPAVAALRSEGLDVRGPYPADTVFVRAAQGEFDAVVAAYHDQGLIPVKLAAFGHAVNVTIGLPYVRTSVDHGTGFDIVGKGIADPSSLLAAMRLAAELVGPCPGGSESRREGEPSRRASRGSGG